ncbi:hypothetical protein Sru01_16160 [Sphaerisporangium rufum]|uniref:Uncharacterized protein n=1 Tax=Sphaerisporangium rufum TaxID=1381558 RepID=A0A919UY98_9ACTN|nr:hypothetical protein [Sphaerisporangium rufum]GII76634.1 hypothetical protein Sru01_16160 [Sphaerisporangium rufum]
MTELSLASLKALQHNPYGKWAGFALLAVLACPLLAVAAGQAGLLWLTVLLGVMAYAALAGSLFLVRRMVRTHRRRAGRKSRMDR